RGYNTLPQIGTSQIVKVEDGAESVEYRAWWQWWERDDAFSHVPKPIPIAGGFEVRDGDRILVSITVEAPSPGDVHFIIMNLRTGVLVPFKVRAPAGIQRLGSTAEWVHERPSKPGSRYRYPLPKFTEVAFRHCLAWSAPCFGAPAVLQALESNVRLMRMKDIFPTPHRSASVSPPKRTSRTSLRINYRD
ncbi:MAG: G1 family glutamic endopeptidase, partial [Candidatus Binatia bacterium]